MDDNTGGHLQRGHTFQLHMGWLVNILVITSMIIKMLTKINAEKTDDKMDNDMDWSKTFEVNFCRTGVPQRPPRMEQWHQVGELIVWSNPVTKASHRWRRLYILPLGSVHSNCMKYPISPIQVGRLQDWLPLHMWGRVIGGSGIILHIHHPSYSSSDFQIYCYIKYVLRLFISCPRPFSHHWLKLRISFSFVVDQLKIRCLLAQQLHLCQ